MVFTLRLFLVFTDREAFVNDSEALLFLRGLSKLSRKSLSHVSGLYPLFCFNLFCTSSEHNTRIAQFLLVEFHYYLCSCLKDKQPGFYISTI